MAAAVAHGSLEGEFARQVVVITGGGAGIGLAAAHLFGQQGGRVALLDRDPAAAENAVAELAGCGVDVRSYQCDVTDGAGVRGALEQVEADFGQIDVLVNNAGGSRTVPIWEMTEPEWDAMVDLNLRATFLCCRAALPGMMRRLSGSIVNLSSCQGVMPAPTRAHYSAAKAGIIGFTRTVAAEVAPSKIRVNAVAPGPTATRRVRSNFTDEGWAQRIADHPLGRIAEPEDIAHAILFFAGPRSRHITGQVLHVNGGLLMP